MEAIHRSILLFLVENFIIYVVFIQHISKNLIKLTFIFNINVYFL
jgi:hypothetical protein